MLGLAARRGQQAIRGSKFCPSVKLLTRPLKDYLSHFLSQRSKFLSTICRHRNVILFEANLGQELRESRLPGSSEIR